MEGEVKTYDGPVNSDFHHAEYEDDQGLFAFLELSDVVGTECVINTESYEMV